MTVTVHFLESTRPDIEQWIASLPGTEPVRRKMAMGNLAIWRDAIRDYRGEVPGAIVSRDLMPKTCLWEYQKGWWFCFVIRDRRRWFRIVEHRITIIGCIRSEKQPQFPKASR